MTTENLFADQVRSEIQRFWGAFSAKSSETLADFYTADATVFGASGARSEPARLTATRRKREYFDAHAQVHVELDPVEVRPLNERSAVASYTLRFHAENVVTPTGQKVSRHIQHARATQVWEIDSLGAPRIVHEHFSSGDLT